jgi:hypothetical protein
MKMHLVVIAIITIVFVTKNNSGLNHKLRGTWQGNYNGHKVSFVFKDDNSCRLEYFSRILNKYERINGKYFVQNSKYPIALSIQNIMELDYSLHTIFEYINSDSIVIAGFSPKWRLRPISFETDRTINLKRVRNVKEKVMRI